MRTRKGIPMSVRIAILGASGAVGSVLAVHILRAGLLEPQDCLMLVGHGTRSTELGWCPNASIFSTRSTTNACRFRFPDIDEFEADIVVVASGETASVASIRRDRFGSGQSPDLSPDRPGMRRAAATGVVHRRQQSGRTGRAGADGGCGSTACHWHGLAAGLAALCPRRCDRSRVRPPSRSRFRLRRARAPHGAALADGGVAAR